MYHSDLIISPRYIRSTAASISGKITRNKFISDIFVSLSGSFCLYRESGLSNFSFSCNSLFRRLGFQVFLIFVKRKVGNAYIERNSDLNWSITSVFCMFQFYS